MYFIPIDHPRPITVYQVLAIILYIYIYKTKFYNYIEKIKNNICLEMLFNK